MLRDIAGYTRPLFMPLAMLTCKKDLFGFLIVIHACCSVPLVMSFPVAAPSAAETPLIIAARSNTEAKINVIRKVAKCYTDAKSNQVFNAKCKNCTTQM